MRDFKNMKLILALIAWMFVLSVVYSILTGCTKTVKSVEYHYDTLTVYHEKKDTVVINTHKTDTIHEMSHHTDSVYVRDSVFVVQRSDTVYYYKERWNNNVQLRHDTLYKHHTDTLYIYKTIVQRDTVYHAIDDGNVVVKEKAKWNWLSWVGLMCIASCLFFVVLLMIKYKKGK